MNTPPPLPQAPKKAAESNRSWFKITTWCLAALLITGSLSSYLRSVGLPKIGSNILGIGLFGWALSLPWRSSNILNIPTYWWDKTPTRLSHRIWWLGLAMVPAFPLLRLYQFSTPPSDTALNHALGLVSQLSALTLGLLIAGLQLLSDAVLLIPVSGIAIALYLIGRRQHTQNGQLPIWFYALTTTALILANAVLDMNPEFFVAQLLIIVFAMANARGHKQGPELALRGFYLFATLSVLVLLEQRSHGHTLLVIALTFTIFTSYVFSGIRTQLIERKLTWAFIGLAASQIAASMAPLFVGSSGSPQSLSQSAAYGYCTDVHNNSQVWLTFPACSAFPRHREAALAHEDCRAGTIQAFDFSTDPPTLTIKHAPFSPDYFGRLEKPICLDDGLVIGMTDVLMGAKKYGGSTLYLQASNGNVSQEHLLQSNAGHTLGRDPESGWIYAVDEFSSMLQRFSPQSTQVENFGPRLKNQSLTLDGEPLSQNRNSLFVSEHYFGNEVIELRLSDGEEKHRYLHNNGGGWAATVDDSSALLYVTGMWSLDIFDLRTGDHLKRHRTGFGARAPVISGMHAQVLVPMTLEGTIRIYNRDTLELEAIHPVGLGVRNLFVSSDESFLLGTNANGTYYWATESFLETNQP